MSRPSALLVLLALGLALGPVVRAETMSERELKRIVQRERLVTAAFEKAGEQADEGNLQTQLQEVMRDYEGLMRKDPKFVPAYVAYGLLLNRVGEAKRSAEIFLRANAVDPKLAIVKNQLGNYCAEEGKYHEALGYYLAAIDLEPKEPLYHYQLGTLLYEYRQQFVESGRFTLAQVLEQSAAAFGHAAEFAPDNVAYAYRFAESYYDRPEADWNAALAAWQKLETRVKAGVEQQTVLTHEANVLLNLGRADEARALLERVTVAPLQSTKQKLIARLEKPAEKAP